MNIHWRLNVAAKGYAAGTHFRLHKIVPGGWWMYDDTDKPSFWSDVSVFDSGA